MGFKLEDGTGKNYSAKVDADNQLHTRSVNVSIQQKVSESQGQAYSVWGTASLVASTTVALHIKNTHSIKDILVTYVRHQVVDATGGTAFPNASNYFQISHDRTRASGGSTATAANLNAGSGNVLSAEVFQGGPTLAGTGIEIDRWYTEDESMKLYNKEGAFVIPPGKTAEFSHIGDHASGGTLYVRATCLQVDPQE